MKKRNRLLVIGLVVAFVALFSVSTAIAATMYNATITWVQTTSDGNTTFRGETTYGQNFTILKTSDNANQLIATVLTAFSNGSTVDVIHTSGTVSAVKMK